MLQLPHRLTHLILGVRKRSVRHLRSQSPIPLKVLLLRLTSCMAAKDCVCQGLLACTMPRAFSYGVLNAAQLSMYIAEVCDESVALSMRTVLVCLSARHQHSNQQACGYLPYDD